MVVRRFKFEEPRIEQIQDLEVYSVQAHTVATYFLVSTIIIDFQPILFGSFPQNDMMKYFREDLHRRLLSTDFKKQIEGLEMLQKVIAF